VDRVCFWCACDTSEKSVSFFGSGFCLADRLLVRSPVSLWLPLRGDGCFVKDARSVEQSGAALLSLIQMRASEGDDGENEAPAGP
jgi:hypothetical protein